MSSMPEQKTPILAYVRQQIERLEQELAILKTTEQQLMALEAGAPTFGVVGAYQGLSPIEAICAFLKRQGKPQSRFVIIQAVIEGGARLGKHKEKSINQSISTNVGLKNPKLKEKNELVGCSTWPDELFGQ